MNANKHLLGLAAVLAATVLTGGAAILGIVHRSPVAAPAATVVQHFQPAPTFHDGEGD